jgi:hypothetical protein
MRQYLSVATVSQYHALGDVDVDGGRFALRAQQQQQSCKAPLITTGIVSWGGVVFVYGGCEISLYLYVLQNERIQLRPTSALIKRRKSLSSSSHIGNAIVSDATPAYRKIDRRASAVKLKTQMKHKLRPTTTAIDLMKIKKKRKSVELQHMLKQQQEDIQGVAHLGNDKIQEEDEEIIDDDIDLLPEVCVFYLFIFYCFFVQQQAPSSSTTAAHVIPPTRYSLRATRKQVCLFTFYSI